MKIILSTSMYFQMEKNLNVFDCGFIVLHIKFESTFPFASYVTASSVSVNWVRVTMRHDYRVLIFPPSFEPA